MQAHVEHLQAVFDLLKAHSFELNRKKCDFAVQRVEYLGHIVSAEGAAA